MALVKTATPISVSFHCTDSLYTGKQKKGANPFSSLFHRYHEVRKLVKTNLSYNRIDNLARCRLNDALLLYILVSSVCFVLAIKNMNMTEKMHYSSGGQRIQTET